MTKLETEAKETSSDVFLGWDPRRWEAINKMYEAGRDTDLSAWKNCILSSYQYGEPFLRFTLTAFISIGAFLNIIYQSYGMAGLPIVLIKGLKSLETEATEIKSSLESIRNQLRQI